MIKLLITGDSEYSNKHYINNISERILDSYNILNAICNPDIQFISMNELSGVNLIAEHSLYIKYKMDIINKPVEWSNINKEPCKIKYNKKNEPYNAYAYKVFNNELSEMLDELDIVIIFTSGNNYFINELIKVLMNNTKFKRLHIVNISNNEE